MEAHHTVETTIPSSTHSHCVGILATPSDKSDGGDAYSYIRDDVNIIDTAQSLNPKGAVGSTVERACPPREVRCKRKVACRMSEHA